MADLEPAEPRRAVVYIDGLNLYGSALKGSTHKWVDLMGVAATLVPGGAELVAVKYFTADLLPYVSEDPDTPRRQRVYLKALKATGVDVRRGTFMQSTEFRTVSENESWAVRVVPGLDPALADALDAAEEGAVRPWKVRVRLPEEKFTDVALGVELVDDFHNDVCEVAVLVTNDADLRPAVAKVVEQGHEVGVFSPASTVSKHLSRAASWSRPIRDNLLATHQLPDIVRVDGSQFERPRVWKPENDKSPPREAGSEPSRRSAE
ncbi:MAG: NYN domain-containing protein [Actinomycetota bacterium]